MSAVVHEVIRRSAGDMGGWVALCKGCPDWMGTPEWSWPEARQHFVAHELDARWADLGLTPVVASGYEVGRLGLTPFAHNDRLIPERPRAREVDVDRLMAWIIGPILFVATAGFILLVGMWPA